MGEGRRSRGLAARMEAALDGLVDPTVIAQPVRDAAGDVVDLVLVYVNLAAAEWGAPVGALLGQRVDPSPSAGLDRLLKVHASGEALALDSVAVSRRGGTERFVDMRVVRLDDDLLLSWRDVTVRLAAEQALAAHGTRFRHVLDNLLDPAVMAEPVLAPDGTLSDLRVIYHNLAAQGGGEPICQGLREQLGRAGVPELYERYAGAFHDGEPVVLDGVPTTDTRTGALRYLDVRARRVGDLLVVTWRDETDRHATERALADSEARFRMAFDDAPVGMVVTSLDAADAGTYLQVNRALTDMLGYAPGDLVGVHGPDLTHPTERETDAVMLRELVTGERSTYHREKRMRRADGRWLWVRMAASAVRSDAGRSYAVVHIEDVTARRAAEAELARRALVDPLTGLSNRGVLLDHIRLEVRELERLGGAVAVFYLDLDRFKDVNDTLGHAAGDEVLRSVAARLSATVRGSEAVGRLAGDEFVVVAHVWDEAQAVRIARRLVDAVIEPMVVGPRAIVVRPSIGVTLTAEPSAAPEDLLREADLAMYEAKRGGRAPWALYDSALHRTAVERLEIEGSLRSAVAEDRLRLLYQPIVDVASGRIVSAEALLRLVHPERGLLAPDAFIEVAEASDLIVPIGAWVFEEACRQLARWQEVTPRMRVAVNVSARQVAHLVVGEQVARATTATGTAASDLLLEITERVLLSADDDVLAELRGVTAAGCGLAIDDFGTGYSSLTYLTRFPVTTLKIDREFVAGLGVGGEDTVVVAAVVGLAKSLGLTAVAEGVETVEQLAALGALGCHRAQGFHLGRPMTSDALLALLRAQG